MDPQDYDPADADDGPKVLRHTEHTARKVHSCDGCSFGGIAPGERYTILVTLDGREMKIERFCSHREYSERGACKRDEEGWRLHDEALREAYEDEAWRERVGPSPASSDRGGLA